MTSYFVYSESKNSYMSMIVSLKKRKKKAAVFTGKTTINCVILLSRFLVDIAKIYSLKKAAPLIACSLRLLHVDS